MRILPLTFILCGLSAIASCDSSITIEKVDNGGGGAPSTSSSNSSTSSSGSVGPGVPHSVALAGRLATYPIAAAPDGSVWVFGGTFAEVESDPYGIWENAWVTKLDPSGNIVFTGIIDGPGTDVEPVAIKTDANGNVVFNGYAKRSHDHSEPLDIWGHKLDTAWEAPFIVKLDHNGNVLWAEAIDAQPTPNDPPAYRFADIGTDGEGNVLAASGVASPFVSDQIDSFVSIRSPTGTSQNAFTMAAMDTVFRKLEVESNGDFWLARSSFYSKVQVQKFLKSGELQMETTGSACWVDVLAFAPDGNAGFFMFRAEDPAEHCNSSIEHHRFDGSVDWQLEGIEFYATHPTLTRSDQGHAWLGLGLEGTINIGGSSLTGTDAGDILVTDIDTDGHFSQTTTYGGPGDDYVVQIALDGAGRRYMAGYFANTIDFGQGQLVNDSNAAHAIFVTRLDP